MTPAVTALTALTTLTELTQPVSVASLRAVKGGRVAGIAQYIDHTCLRADAVGRDIAALCQEARDFGCAAVCVNPRWVEQVDGWLTGSPVAVCTVVGFPLGAGTTRVKTAEAERAVRDGAVEIDMVMDIGAFLDGRHASVRSDIESVRRATPGSLLKVILETAYLDDARVRVACSVAVDAGADFVKTSTGFGPAGATEEVVRLMRESVGSDVGVKASGGIRDLAAARKMLDAGASRIGTSSTEAILEAVEAEG
jgi:deoxyribose-phosphate aldolase